MWQLLAEAHARPLGPEPQANVRGDGESMLTCCPFPLAIRHVAKFSRRLGSPTHSKKDHYVHKS